MIAVVSTDQAVQRVIESLTTMVARFRTPKWWYVALRRVQTDARLTFSQGIVFCMIMLPGMSETLARATRSTASSQGANSLPLRPMTIKITTETHRESGNGLHSKHSELSSDRCAPAGHDSDDADTDIGLKSSIV